MNETSVMNESSRRKGSCGASVENDHDMMICLLSGYWLRLFDYLVEDYEKVKGHDQCHAFVFRQKQKTQLVSKKKILTQSPVTVLFQSFQPHFICLYFPQLSSHDLDLEHVWSSSYTASC